MSTVIELVLTPRCAEAVEELERFWQARESTMRWDDSEEVCERLLEWLRNPHTEPLIDVHHRTARSVLP